MLSKAESLMIAVLVSLTAPAVGLALWIVWRMSL